jgi:hypothetical protein
MMMTTTARENDDAVDEKHDDYDNAKMSFFVIDLL